MVGGDVDDVGGDTGAVVVVVASMLRLTNTSPLVTVTGYWCSPVPSGG